MKALLLFGKRGRGAAGPLLSSPVSGPTLPPSPRSASLQPSIPQTSSPSFALVATLLMITVITGAAVAFFQSTRIERFVARNYADLARAEMAADSGYALATAVIRTGSTNDDFIVALNADRQLFIGNGTNQTAPLTFAYLPLFSSSTNMAAYGTNAALLTNGIPSTNVSGGSIFTNTLPGGLAVTSPTVAWVFLTNSAGRTNARFVFWVEDLAGRLDLSVAGSTGTNAARPTGTNPAELALWRLFTNTVLDSNNPVVNSLTSVRGALVTPATARLVDSNFVTTNLLADLAAGLIHDTNEPEIVPFGLGYASNGQPKLNLNLLVSQPATAMDRITKQISDNLPDFTKRAGGMDGSDYVKNLAANMIDYADTDTNCTTDTANSPPRWRGVEAIPWPNEVFVRFSIETGGRKVEGANWVFKLLVKHYVELWNLSSASVAVNPTSYSISNSLLINLQCYDYYSRLDKADPNNKPVAETFTNAAFTLAPNSYGVISAPTRTFTISFSTNKVPTNIATPALSLKPSGNLTANQYTFSAGGKVVAGTTGGWWCGPDTNLGIGSFHFIVGGANFGTSDAGTTYNLSGGDPRGQLFVNAPSMEIKYNNSTPGGRNWYGPADGPVRIVAPEANWVDGGHSSGTNTPPADSVTPPKDAKTDNNIQEGIRKAGNTNHWIQKVNDTGSFTNITELGHIFDPIQWGGYFPDSEPFHLRDTNAWMVLLDSSKSYPSKTSCGRNTLRIGRPEQPRFNTNGLRATQLLDLFGVADKNASTVTNLIPGRINLNTATTNVLRALAAGVVHVRDPGLLPNGTNFVVPTNAVTAFVDGVANYRSSQPFLAPSQLASLTNPSSTNTWPSNSVFGNTNLFNVTEWNDSAAEEWFGKVYPLATVRSRNFLVHVIAQAMSTNTNFPSRPIAISKKAFQVYAEPARDGNGLTTNVTIRKLNTWTY